MNPTLTHETPLTPSADDTGLSYVPYHAAQQTNEIELNVYADMFEVKVPPKPREEKPLLLNPDGTPKNRAKRGEVKMFSNKSRSRMLKMTAKVREFIGDSRPVFITLTYTGKDLVDHSPEKWSRDLDTFRKRLVRFYEAHGLGDVKAIWRKEFKTRQSGELKGQVVPHFHLILFPPVKFPVLVALDFGKFIADAWWEVVGTGDADHRKAGTQVEELSSKRKAKFYVSKYVAKQDDAPVGKTGRMWGVWGELDMSASMSVVLTPRQYIAFRRHWRKFLEKRGLIFYADVLRRYKTSFSIFGKGDDGNLSASADIVRVMAMCMSY